MTINTKRFLSLALFWLLGCGAIHQLAGPPAPTDSTIVEKQEAIFRRPESIIFAGGSGENISLNLYQVNPDGTELDCITCEANEAMLDLPTWSPDGRAIAYTITAAWGNGLGVMKEDILLVYAFSEHDWYASPAWSPDGKQVTFVYREYVGPEKGLFLYDPYGVYHICIAPYQDKHVEIDEARCQPFEGLSIQPDWSPDGKHIVFALGIDVGEGIISDIWQMNADGSNRQNLTKTPESSEYSPVWSPDGKKIAYERYGDIWVMNASGSDQTNLTDGADGYNQFPTWSPDSRHIVLVTNRTSEICGPQCEYTELYIMNADGSNPVNITNNPRIYVTAPDWGPRRPDEYDNRSWTFAGIAGMVLLTLLIMRFTRRRRQLE